MKKIDLSNGRTLLKDFPKISFLDNHSELLDNELYVDAAFVKHTDGIPPSENSSFKFSFETVEALQAISQDEEFVARIGQSEFAMLMELVTSNAE